MTTRTFSMAPGAESVDKPQRDTTADQVPTVPSPTISIIGCGGFGINIARAVSALHGLDASVVRTVYYDTSLGNVRPGETLIRLGDGHGSGTVRGTHLEDIKKKVSGYTAEQAGLSDINLIFTALGGGSGTVVGPSLVKLAAGQGKRCILIGVADTASQGLSSNTYGTLNNLIAIAERETIYLPMMVYSNNGMSRQDVDKGVTAQVVHLIRALAAPSMEVDRRDRINFLDGITTFDAEPGLRFIHVIGGHDYVDGRAYPGEIWKYSEDDVYDAVLRMGVQTDDGIDHLPLRPNCRFLKDGIFSTVKLSPVTAIISSGADAAKQVLEAIEHADRLYSGASVKSGLTSAVAGARVSKKPNVDL